MTTQLWCSSARRRDAEAAFMLEREANRLGLHLVGARSYEVRRERNRGNHVGHKFRYFASQHYVRTGHAS